MAAVRAGYRAARIVFAGVVAFLLAEALMAVGAPRFQMSGKIEFYPPEKYWGNAVVVVRTVPSEFVNLYCNNKNLILACQTPLTIVMPNPCEHQFDGEVYAELFCHEKAHFNGWNGAHDN